MGRAVIPKPTFDYSDNEQAEVATRLLWEIGRHPASLDVVTGYFGPSVWDAVGEGLQAVGRFRLLLGKSLELIYGLDRKQAEAAIQSLVVAALRGELQARALPTREEAASARSLLAFLSRPDEEVDVRVWTEGFLHAKAYILHGSAGVGSANFTLPGMTRNRELVGWRQDYGVVAELQEWFDRHWEQAEPYKEPLRALLADSRFGTRAWTPYDLLIRTLAEKYGTEVPRPLEGADFTLKWFQQDAVWQLIKLLRGPAGGALLADAVGLGKTFMAMGVIYHYLYQSEEKRRGKGQPVLLIVPASVEPMWRRNLEKYGLLWACRLLTVQSLREEADTAPYARAELVVVDEAHRLRGGGVWFRKVLEIVTAGDFEKRVLLLSATPVQTGLRDLTNLLRVLTKNQRGVWAPAIADFHAYLQRVEKRQADPYPVLERCVVRRSRTDILKARDERRSAGILTDPELKLPTRRLEHVTYRYTLAGGDDSFARFADTIRHLELAPYDLERFRRTPQAQPAQPSELAGLQLVGLLKRFESSLRAVHRSLHRLHALLARSAEALGATPPRMLDLQSLLVRTLLRQDAEEDEDEAPDDGRWEAVLAQVQPLPDVGDYDLPAALESIARDRAAVRRLLADLPPEVDDGKVAALRQLLTDRRGLGAPKAKALVFTQFRDTADYLAERLGADPEVGPVALVHGGVPARERPKRTAAFDPEGDLATLRGEAEPRVLISTDVLAEGHNLQLAQAVVNFDLHWNPQVAVQRAGRVDRLESPHKVVRIVSFLPEEGLEAHLGLVRALDARFGLIHFLGLGDEPVTKLAGDYQAVTFEQLRRLYADEANVLDEVERSFVLGATDYMRQPLEAFLREAAAAKLAEIPVGVQSARATPVDWPYGPGVFIAFRLGEPGQGETAWRFYPDGGAAAVTDETAVFPAILCQRHEPRATVAAEAGPGGLIDWDLLRRAAQEVADAVNLRQATAQVARGGSELSRRWRNDLRTLAEEVGYEGAELQQLLDRLEQVRVEDFDAKGDYRRFRDRLRAARRKGQPMGSRREELTQAVEIGGRLFGRPQGTDAAGRPVSPEDLTFVSWQRLVSAARATDRRPVAPPQAVPLAPGLPGPRARRAV